MPNKQLIDLLIPIFITIVIFFATDSLPAFELVIENIGVLRSTVILFLPPVLVWIARPYFKSN
jgi:hypothetical protein